MVSHPGTADGADRLRPVNGEGTRLTPLNAPRPLQVESAPNGEPAAVVVGRRALRVIEVQDRWRIDDLWWRQPLSRLYFQVLLEDGRVLTIFHDLEAGTWAAQQYR